MQCALRLSSVCACVLLSQCILSPFLCLCLCVAFTMYSLCNATEAVHDEHYFAGLSLIVLQTYCVQEPLSLIHLNQLFLVRKRMKKVSGLMESEAQHYVIWILMILRLLK